MDHWELYTFLFHLISHIPCIIILEIQLYVIFYCSLTTFNKFCTYNSFFPWVWFFYFPDSITLQSLCLPWISSVPSLSSLTLLRPSIHLIYKLHLHINPYIRPWHILGASHVFLKLIYRTLSHRFPLCINMIYFKINLLKFWNRKGNKRKALKSLPYPMCVNIKKCSVFSYVWLFTDMNMVHTSGTNGCPA